MIYRDMTDLLNAYFDVQARGGLSKEGEKIVQLLEVYHHAHEQALEYGYIGVDLLSYAQKP